MAMGKLHKDIAMFMVKCLEDEDISKQKLIKVSCSGITTNQVKFCYIYNCVACFGIAGK